jgi:hypothetical protein
VRALIPAGTRTKDEDGGRVPSLLETALRGLKSNRRAHTDGARPQRDQADVEREHGSGQGEELERGIVQEGVPAGLRRARRLAPFPLVEPAGAKSTEEAILFFDPSEADARP